MKKLNFLLLLSIFCFEKNMAQTKIFFQTGLNATNTIFQNTFNDQHLELKSSFLITPNFGIDVHLPIYKKVALNIAAQYSSKGHTTFNDGGDCNNAPIFFGKTTYIDVLPRLAFPIYKKIELLGGVNLGIKLKEKYQQSDLLVDGNAEKTSIQNSFDANNRYDFGGLLGFRVKFERFNIQAHYNRSISSVMNKEFIERHFVIPNQKIQTYNQTFQIALSYYLEPLIK